MQRVAVAVQAGDADSGSLEQSEEVVPGSIADEDVVHRGDVCGGEEPAGVDLEAGQPQIGDDLDRLGEGAVVQDRVVDAESHGGCVLSQIPTGTEPWSTRLWK